MEKQIAIYTSPRSKLKIPIEIARKEINLADAIATLIPALLLPVMCHIIDFNMTPPSRGIMGSKLNNPITRLRLPTWLNKFEITIFVDKLLPNTIIRKANIKLIIGPEIAILKLPLEVLHSFSRLAIPPRKKSVISLTFRPCAIATKEWASSCNKTDKNKRDDVKKPINQPFQIEA